MDPSECLRRVSTERVATLATIGAERPHLVPVVFAVDEDRLVTAVDHKPKRSVRLQRLVNIARDPGVTVLVNRYDDNWERLWWVRADGSARILDDGSEMRRGIDLLVERYEQYRQIRPQGPLIEISVVRWTGWSA